MLRRLPTLLLAALVVLTSVALGTCPVGRCAAMQSAAEPGAAEPQPEPHHDHAAMPHGDHGAHRAMQHGDHGARHAMHAPASGAHDCCTRDGISAQSCCPDSIQLAGHRATASGERAGAGIALVATQPVPARLAAFPTATADPPRAAPPDVPSGTLIAQHTSLLV